MHESLDNSFIMSSRSPPPIDFQIAEMEGVSSEAVLTVNEVAPFSIVHASQGWLDTFRFSKEEIMGRNLRVINGPSTDMSLLHNIIQATPEEKHKTAAITLYSSSGHGQVMVVKTFKQFGLCTLTMTSSDAISSQQVTTHVDKARIVVTSEPYYVQQVSIEFSRMFGLSEQEIVGRTIRMLDGPHTDILAFQQLLTKTKTGFAQRGTMVAFTKDCVELVCDVELVPVVGHGGVISHLQIDFTSQGTNVVPNFQPHFEEWQNEEPTSSSHRASAAPQWQPPSQADPSVAFALPPVHIGFSYLAQHQQAPHQPSALDSQPAHTLSTASAASAFTPAHAGSHMLLPGPTERASSLPTHLSAPRRCESGASRAPSAAAQRIASMPAFHQEFEAMSMAGPTRSTSAQSDASHASATRARSRPRQPTSRASSSASTDSGPAGAERPRRRGNRSALRLFPRRKAGESDLKALGGPVDLSKEIVDEFVGMSMKEASQKLGISASAMKKACRKLGIQKWPHKSLRASVDVMTYNSAYVRRLYSKYAEKPEGGDPLLVPEMPEATGTGMSTAGPSGYRAEEHAAGGHSPSDISEGSEADELSPCATPCVAAGHAQHAQHALGHAQPVYHHLGPPQHHTHMHHGRSDGATPSVVWDNSGWGMEQPEGQGHARGHGGAN